MRQGRAGEKEGGGSRLEGWREEQEEDCVANVMSVAGSPAQSSDIKVCSLDSEEPRWNTNFSHMWPWLPAAGLSGPRQAPSSLQRNTLIRGSKAITSFNHFENL